jgi:hypothetical protein
MKSVFSIEYSLGHPHIGLLYQFIVGEYGPVLNIRPCSHQSYVIEEEGTNLVYYQRYVRGRLDVRVQNERDKECRRWAVFNCFDSYLTHNRPGAAEAASTRYYTEGGRHTHATSTTCFLWITDGSCRLCPRC